MINQLDNTRMMDLVLRGRAAGPKTSGGSSFSRVLDSAQGAMQQTDLDDIFERAAQEYDIPVALLKAIAKAESGFNSNAVSRAGASGVMQLMPATAKSLGVTDPFDPEQNIMGGAKYISGMLDRYDGDIQLALAAYNAGSGNVKKYGGVPPFPETQNYIQKIMGYMGADLTVPSLERSGTTDNSAVVSELIQASIAQDDYQAMVSRWKSELDHMIFSALTETPNDEDETRI